MLQTWDPVWKDNQVPELLSFISNKEYLLLSHVFVVVKNYDSMNAEELGTTITSSDLTSLGQGAISLQNAFGDKPAEFVVELMLKGSIQGILRGSLQALPQ